MRAERPRRSLMLAGGGMKVAFQAGVLQVWLDEAGIEFDHADGCSGGAFNLAMLCQGNTGMEIADAWRTTHPRDGVSLRLADLARFPFGRSLVTMEKYRKYVFRFWRLDPARVRATALAATFNSWDITHQRLRVFSASEFSFDVLTACASLPVWFPPVEIDGDLYTDAVFATDANIDAALEAGAEEIWIIWTVSHRPEWLPGTITQFFHALEIAANSHLRDALRRIEENNAAFRRGEVGPLGRCVTVRCLDAEVPLQYLVVLGRDRLHRVVEMGVAAARAWCDAEGIPRTRTPRRSSIRYEDGVSLSFRDRMSGRFTPVGGLASDRKRGIAVEAHLTLCIDDAGAFATDPTHPARVVGFVRSPLFADGRAEVVGGEAHVLVSEPDDPTRKRFSYRVLLRDGQRRTYTLRGTKRVDSGRIRQLWHETTTLDTSIVTGHVGAGDGTKHRLLAAGFLHLRPIDVARQVLTMGRDGPRPLATLRGIARFGGAFGGNLWDVYARRVSTYAPF